MSNNQSSENNQPKLSDTDIAAALSAGLDQTQAEEKDENIDRVLNAYRIELKLGEGGMGKVYLARHELIGKLACIKICKYRAGSNLYERFLREAKILARLDHPNLLTAFDFGEFEGGHYILMPYIKALSLSEIIKQNKQLSVEESVQMVIQAAKGLYAAHQAGVVHRDVKPGNLLVEAEGKVWVSDFGISFFSDDETNAFVTRTGETLGSPSYIAPEQIEDHKIDHRADIYALGATLYHLICNKPPYQADNPMVVLRKHLDEELVIPDSLKSCPSGLIQCIKKMLAKKPDHRQQTMLEVVNELEKAMGQTNKYSENTMTTVRLSEETMQQIIQRSHEIEQREKEYENKLSRQDLYEIGEELDIPRDRMEKARREIEDEKRNHELLDAQNNFQQTSQSVVRDPEIQNKIEIMDKIWIIMAILVLGMYIPVIDLYFCKYIGL